MHNKQGMIYMSNRNGLSVSAFAAPFDNPFLDEKNIMKSFYVEMILIKLYIVQNGELKRYIV